MEDELRQSNSKESLYSAYSRIGDWEIGDRCKVGGREGNVVFIGPTSFAPGEWIGVVLDEATGKNDGSVDGKRYFKCEQNHGLFCKSSKLEHVLPPPALRSPGSEASTSKEYSKNYGFMIGDRVVVSGGKLGTVRFLGPVDFQEGIWAGIELDTPHGKNDGSVQGKRYFTTKPLYGLFASAAKVSRASAQGPPKLKVRQTKASALRQRTQSQESLSSLGNVSLASSRLSRTAYTPKTQRPVVIASSQGQSEVIKSLQDTLREKERHIEQMIKEREFERSEMARMVSSYEGITKTETGGRNEDNELVLLKKKLGDVEAELLNVNIQLKERNEDVENLRFLLDEEKVMNEELKERLSEVEKVSREKLDVEIGRIKDELTKKELLCSTLDAYFSGKPEWKEKNCVEKLEGLVKELREAEELLNKKLGEGELVRLQALNTKSGTGVEAGVDVNSCGGKESEMKQPDKFEREKDEERFEKVMNENATLAARVAQLNDECKMLTERVVFVNSLTHANEELTAKLQSVEQENKRLATSKDNLAKDCLDVRQKYEEVQKTLAVCKNQIRDLDLEKIALMNEKTALEEKLKELNDSSVKWQLEMERLELEKAALVDGKRSTEEELGNLRSDYEEIKKQIKSEFAKLNQKDSKCKESEEKLAELQSRLMTTQTTIEQYKEKVREYEMGQNKLRDVNSELGRKLDISQARLHDLLCLFKLFENDILGSSEYGDVLENVEDEKAFRDRLKKVDGGMKETLSKLSALKSDYCDITKENCSLKQELNTTKARINELMSQLHALEVREDTVDTAYRDSEEKVENAVAGLDGCGEKPRVYEEELGSRGNERLQDEISACRTQIDDFMIQLKRMGEENKKLEEEAKEAVQRKADVELILAKAEEKIRVLEGEVVAAQKPEQDTTIRLELDELKLYCSQLSNNNESLKAENSTLKSSLEEQENIKLTLEHRLQEVTRSFEEIKNEAEVVVFEAEATQNAENLAAEHEELQSELKELKRKNTELEAILRSAEIELSDLKLENSKKADLEFNYEESNKMIEELNIKLNDTVKEKRRLEDLLSSHERQAKDGSRLEELVREVQESIFSLKSQNEDLRRTIIGLESEKKAAVNDGVVEMLKDEIEKLNSCVALFTVENDKLKVELKESKNELQKQMELVEELPKMKKELIGRDHEVELLHSLVKKLELELDGTKTEKLSTASEQDSKTNGVPQVLSAEELAAANSEKWDNEILRKEITSLKERLFALEEEKLKGEIIVSKAKQRSATFDQLNKNWEEKEAEYLRTIRELEAYSHKTETEKLQELEQQISFLNSIIADQQKKEAELVEEIRILNNIPSQEALSDLPKENVSLRLYCDICEEFDLHDTADCPKELVAQEEFKAHSHFAGDHSVRPYCEICEAFVHDTESCPRKVASNGSGDGLS